MFMRDRIEILRDLVALNADASSLGKELSEYPWDTNSPLLVINTPDFISVFKRYVANQVTTDELVDWANAIEMRDDLDFVDDALRDMIFKLANPEINGMITTKLVDDLINTLLKDA
jgi:hypothetical protein